MKEHSLIERMMMILRVIASIVSWVVLILIKIVRDRLPIGAKRDRTGVDSTTTQT